MVYQKADFLYLQKTLRLPKPYISTVVAVYGFMRPLFPPSFHLNQTKGWKKLRIIWSCINKIQIKLSLFSIKTAMPFCSANPNKRVGDDE